MQRLSIWKTVDRQIILMMAAALITIGFYTFILVFPLPIQVTGAFHSPSLVLIGVLVLLFTLLLSRRGRKWEWITFLMALWAFSAPLVYLWQSAHYDGNIIGGLLPFSDASGYYSDALKLILGDPFSTFSSRRPLFAGLLSVFLALTGKNLQITLALFVAMNVVVCYLAAREVTKTHGSLAGAFFLIILFLYYKRCAGYALTENLGVFLGVLAFTLIWRGARKKHEIILLVGVFLLALALIARAGAFFILPALILWGGFYLRGQRRVSFSFIFKGIGVVLVAFFLNYLLLKAVGSPSGVAFANYAQTFYGLVSGNLGWTRVYRDYPDARQSEIMGLAIQKFRDDPTMLLIGMGKSYIDYISPYYGAFSFLPLDHKYYSIVNIACWLFSAFGLVTIFIGRHRLRSAFILFAFLGILLSVSLVPPIDASRMRAYAATIPFTAFLLVNGLGLPFRFRTNAFEPGSSDALRFSRFDRILITSSLSLVGICILGPMIVKGLGSPETAVPPLDCPDGQDHIRMGINPGSYMVLVPDHSIPESYLPYIRISDYVENLKHVTAPYKDLLAELKNIPIGHILTTNNNQYENNVGTVNRIIVFLELGVVDPPESALSICAALTQNQWLKKYHFYIADNPPSSSFMPKGLFFYSRIIDRNIRRGYAILLGLVIFSAGLNLVRSYPPRRHPG